MIIGNGADTGGALCIDYNCMANVSYCSFNNNSATNIAGAVFLYKQSSILLLQSRIEGMI